MSYALQALCFVFLVSLASCLTYRLIQGNIKSSAEFWIMFCCCISLDVLAALFLIC